MKWSFCTHTLLQNNKNKPCKCHLIRNYSTAGTSSTSHQAKFYYYAIMLMACYSFAAQSSVGVWTVNSLIVSEKHEMRSFYGLSIKRLLLLALAMAITHDAGSSKNHREKTHSTTIINNINPLSPSSSHIYSPLVFFFCMRVLCSR